MKKISVIYTILSAIIFLLLFGCWFSFLSSVRSQEKEISKLESEIATNKGEEATLFSDATLAHNVALPTDALTDFFASSSNVAYLIETLEKNATVQKVTVSVGNIADEQSASSVLSPLSFSLSASGTWNNLVAFAATIENISYDIALNKISFFRNATDPKGIWHFQADAQSYVSN